MRMRTAGGGVGSLLGDPDWFATLSWGANSELGPPCACARRAVVSGRCWVTRTGSRRPHGAQTRLGAAMRMRTAGGGVGSLRGGPDFVAALVYSAPVTCLGGPPCACARQAVVSDHSCGDPDWFATLSWGANSLEGPLCAAVSRNRTGDP
ncbi:hypothetical protein THAOC_19720, partial [Thalassiosira oceanica]